MQSALPEALVQLSLEPISKAGSLSPASSGEASYATTDGPVMSSCYRKPRVQSHWVKWTTSQGFQSSFLLGTDTWMHSYNKQSGFWYWEAVSDWEEMHTKSGGLSFLSGQRTSAGTLVSTYKWKLWDLANPEVEPRSPAFQEDSLPSEPSGEPIIQCIRTQFWCWW